MADITINIEKLESALGKLDTLITTTDSQRAYARSNTPTELPSLGDENLGKTTTWLTEQKPELQTRLDLAKLLDEDGDGEATYSVEYGDQLWEVKRALGDEMTEQLENLDIDSVEGRERAELLASLLNQYKDDPDIPWQVMNALGPEGLTEVMNKLRNLTGEYGATYTDLLDDPGAENQALIDLQESMGTGLAGMFSSASTYMDGEWGTKVAEDPWAASVLLRYIDNANRDLSPMVFEAMGVELKERENNDPMLWQEMFGNGAYSQFGNENFSELNPMREYLNVADNSTRAAQAVMGNEDLLRYFTSERLDHYDDLSNQAGKVLGVATIDAANSDNYQYAMAAAEISSNLVYQLGGDAEPLDGVKEEIGGIIGTYIMDADRVFDGQGDSEAGYHLWGENGSPYGYGLDENSGLPRYGINMDAEHLRNLLEDVGDNDAAKSAVGTATTLLNQVRLDNAAGYQGDDSGAMDKAAQEASSLTGFMTDSLINGDIDNEEEAAAERKKVAEFFTAPIDLIPTDRAPVIGDLLIGEMKDAIIDGYTADKTQDAIGQGNSDVQTSTNMVKLQALYSMETHGLDNAVDGWPTENGRPKAPDQLSDEEVRTILEQSDTGTGLVGSVTGNIDGHWRDNVKLYGDN
jgi:hypothetical protein